MDTGAVVVGGELTVNRLADFRAPLLEWAAGAAPHVAARLQRAAESDCTWGALVGAGTVIRFAGDGDSPAREWVENMGDDEIATARNLFLAEFGLLFDELQALRFAPTADDAAYLMGRVEDFNAVFAVLARRMGDFDSGTWEFYPRRIAGLAAGFYGENAPASPAMN